MNNGSISNATNAQQLANSTLPIGMMLLGLAALSIGFHMARQSNIIACIIIGAVVGAMQWDQAMDLSVETANAYSEVGIILVLFTGGMEVDVPGFLKMWKPALINGFGQIGITLAIFAGLGAGTGTTTTVVSTVYFGLSCTVSSTILVISCLSSRGELQSMHGQIILGLMALQDINAVLALSVMPGFDTSLQDPPPIGNAIGLVLGKLVVMLISLFLLNKFLLNRLFRIFAKSGEMLFIGTFSYCLGVAGVCSIVGLGEMGAFWAGVSIAALPYRHEIETHAEPIKLFGVVLFFFMLGIDLHLSPDSLRRAMPMAAAVALLTVFVLPVLMWILGAISRMDGRSSFLVGHTINQISEFSLILASLAKSHGIFDDNLFMIVTIATLLTFFLSSTGHSLTERVYRAVRCALVPLDRLARLRVDKPDDFPLHDHVVLLGHPRP